MEDFFVQECCVHGTDLENHGPTSILCDDPLPIESTPQSERKTFLAECNVCILIDCKRIKTSRKWQTKDRFIFSYSIVSLG